MPRLAQLKSTHDRLMAIKERQKIDGNHAPLDRYELQKELLEALPGLLRVCNAYIEAETELGFQFGICDEHVYRTQAEAKLEELLR